MDKHDRPPLFFLRCPPLLICSFLFPSHVPLLMYIMFLNSFFLFSLLVFVQSILFKCLMFSSFSSVSSVFFSFPFSSFHPPSTQHYFVDAWNTFDALIVVGSIVDIAITEVNVSSPNSRAPFLPARPPALPSPHTHTHTHRLRVDTHLACFQMIRRLLLKLPVNSRKQPETCANMLKLILFSLSYNFDYFNS